MSNNQSLNQTIVREFEKLVNFVQHQLDEDKTDKKKHIANTFRLKQIKNALTTIKK